MGLLVLLSEVQCPGRNRKDSSCSPVQNSAVWSSLSPVHILALRNPRRSLPTFLEQQLHKQTWASWAPLTDAGPPHLWQVAVTNFWQGHSKKLRIKETRRQHSGVWELKKGVSMSYTSFRSWSNPLYGSFFCFTFYPRCQLWWWKRNISKWDHHFFNQKITHHMTGSHNDPSFNLPHLHLVIIMRPSVKLIASCSELTVYKHTHRFRQSSHPLSSSVSLSLSHTHSPRCKLIHTHAHTHILCTYKWLLSFQCYTTKWTKLYLNRGTYKKLHSHWYNSLWMRQVFLYILIIGSCGRAYSRPSNPPITESPF